VAKSCSVGLAISELLLCLRPRCRPQYRDREKNDRARGCDSELVHSSSFLGIATPTFLQRDWGLDIYPRVSARPTKRLSLEAKQQPKRERPHSMFSLHTLIGAPRRFLSTVDLTDIPRILGEMFRPIGARRNAIWLAGGCVRSGIASSNSLGDKAW